MNNYRVEVKSNAEYDCEEAGMFMSGSGLSMFSHNKYFEFESWYNLEDQLHREGGPAIIVRDLRNGNIVGQEWYKGGLRHREGGLPSLMTAGDDSKCEWRRDGKLHREGGPAHIFRTSDGPEGVIIEEQWFKDGRLHRRGGPADIALGYLGEIVRTEHWYVDGLLHRLDGPAAILRDSETAIAIIEQWRFHGALHKIGAPAYIERDGQTGEVIKEEYHRCDILGPSRAPAP